MNSYEKFLKENFGKEYSAVYSAIRQLYSPESIKNFINDYADFHLQNKKINADTLAEIKESITGTVEQYVSDHDSNESSLKKAEKWQSGLEFVLSKTE
jgi:hypothetical protein